jgi:hypothetical protein
MSELRIWTDDEDWYIATNADEAARIRRELCGDDADEIGPLTLAPDPLTAYPEDGPKKVTKSHAEWIQEAGGKPGFFASSNW